MGYVQDTLSGNEEVTYKARFHWLYTLAAFLYLILLGVFVIGIYLFFKMMIFKWTTEVAVTNKRLIYKTGWIKRDTQEIRVDKIEEINLDQGFWGRIFDFGKLKISGTGGGVIELPTLDDPLGLRTAIGNSRSLVV